MKKLVSIIIAAIIVISCSFCVFADEVEEMFGEYGVDGVRPKTLTVKSGEIEMMKYEFEYDEFDRVKKWTTYQFDGAKLAFSEYIEYEYDANGNETGHAAYREKAPGEYVKYDESISVYNEKNLEIKHLYIEYDSNGEYDESSCSFYEYDDHGNEVLRTYYTYYDAIGDAPISGMSKNMHTYTYNPDGTIAETKITYDLCNGDGEVISYFETNEYDEKGRLTKMTNYTPTPHGEKNTDSYSFFEYKYNEAGKETEEIHTRVDGGVAAVLDKNLIFYDEKGRCIGSEDYEDEEGVLMLDSSSQVVYDDEKNTITHEFYEADDGVPVLYMTYIIEVEPESENPGTGDALSVCIGVLAAATVSSVIAISKKHRD